MALAILLSVVITAALDTTEAKFDIFWNAPTFLCSHNFGVNLTEDLLKYGIKVNNKESFNGDEIVIFYENALGKYPKIEDSGDINGGIPSLDRLDEHLKIAKMNISEIIPNENFSGLGVIDWESWRPSWHYLWGKLSVYKNRTIELVKKDHANSSHADIERAAKSLWENTAKQWMLQTLQLAKGSRSKGKWCYYLFPDCYNYDGKDDPSQFFCSKAVQSTNDRLSWMWEESTALCPSIYLHDSQLDTNMTQQIWYIYGRLAEAVRVSRPQTKIYPYVNYMIAETKVHVPEDSFWQTLALVASMGLDGSVIWGSSSYFPNKTTCESLKNFVHDVIGPAANTISKNANLCSKVICNGRGGCTWPEEPYTSWRYFVGNKAQKFNLGNIVCKCHTGKGRYCQLESE